jgi:splicing factor 3B subunit 3
VFSPLQVHQETFGRSGCRRIVPGQYVAADPKGRACIIGAVEKQKFVYVLNRDSAANLTISSPLEAHKSHNIVFSMCALDCGFDNPIFAAIELDYADADQVGPRGGKQQQEQQQEQHQHTSTTSSSSSSTTGQQPWSAALVSN